MRGSIFSFDEAAGEGLIMGEDGGKYRVTRSILHKFQTISVGAPVLFDVAGADVSEAMPHPAGWDGKAPVMKFEEIDEHAGPGFLIYFVVCLIKYLDPTGRAQRVEIWSWTVSRLILDATIIFVSQAQGDSGTAAIVYGVYFLLMLPPSVSVAIRRLHDAGNSGVRLLLGFGVFSLGYLYAMPSQPFANKYGRHPKAISMTSRAAVASVTS